MLYLLLRTDDGARELMDDLKADFADERRDWRDGDAEDGLTRCLSTLSTWLRDSDGKWRRETGDTFY